MLKITLFVLCVLIIILSIKIQMIINERRRNELPEVINSPFSQALTQLLGIAGGIYLSLVLLTSFLGLEIPEKINFGSGSLDPLAVFSLVIAIVQPFILRIWQNFKSN